MKEIFRIIEGTEEMKKHLGKLFPLFQLTLDDMKTEFAVEEYKMNNEPLDYKVGNKEDPKEKAFIYRIIDKEFIRGCTLTILGPRSSLKEWSNYIIENSEWRKELYKKLIMCEMDCIEVDNERKMYYAAEMHCESHRERFKHCRMII